MDDTEDDAKYAPTPYDVSHHQGYGYLNGQKLPVGSSRHSLPVRSEYAEDDNDYEEEDDGEQLGQEEDDDDGDGDDEDNDQGNGIHVPQKDENGDGDDSDDDSDDDDDDDDDKQKSYTIRIEDDLESHPKKRKLKSLISTYEFAPRVPAPAVAAPSAPKPAFGGRNALTDWTEHETFVLLDAWGDRFIQRGKKSLRSEEWQEVAERVKEVSKTERTDTQCRNRLDTLKKKYKKEKAKLVEMGGGTCKWVYFSRMDKLLSSPQQQAGLSCGLDSGEYVFSNPRVYLNRANVFDEMRDSPGNSESTGEEDSVGLHPKKKSSRKNNDETSSFKLLADSIQKFGEIYEKIENNKRQQMVELEKMRMDFHKELEMQKRQIFEKVQNEIAKLQQRDEEENDESAENGM
ncbi:trihelix transcription factor ENAP1-like [Prosopis cineraria]|uniref:trihelix transcription factor ENAP1-like n=1 Tax=Prosopis cineraria TaxID=364024 RepID=UPI0024107D88|nr:trihelix transcription factor ENAP1-like [Prosopis cineraria]